ncbi:MAG: choice-of-anchor B family protein [Bacteroidota bacterium]
MKKILYLVIFLPTFIFAQEAEEANMLFNWDDTDIPGSFAYDNAYNEIWGFVANNREFAVIGSTLGTHFVDVTDPANSVELTNAYVQGATSSPIVIHRDYHDYQCYLYAVADEGNNSTLQIIDISDMPYSNSVVYDSPAAIRTSHNIFIDSTNAILYACHVTFTSNNSTQYYRLAAFSLADPVNPTLIQGYSVIDGVSIPVIHDIHVRDNIAFLNGSYDGLLVVDFTDPTNPDLLTNLDTYPQQGYNHSGWLSDDGNYYFMADETHNLDIKVYDVSDLTDIQLVTTFDAESTEMGSIAHNLLVRGNYLYASYYYDGLQVYDISDPTMPRRVAYFDTYPGTNILSYEGAWGVYPFLPSGNILISDMQTGLYVFEKIDETITGQMDLLGTPTNCSVATTSVIDFEEGLVFASVYPQPFGSEFMLEMELEEQQEARITMTDISGKEVLDMGTRVLSAGIQTHRFNVPSAFANGLYMLRITGEKTHFVRKIVKQ